MYIERISSNRVDCRRSTERLPSSGAYLELEVGESIICTTPGSEPCAVDLQHVDERAATVRVNGAVIPISLGHFARRSLGNPADDVVSMVNRERLRIGADMTRNYMNGSKYSLSMVNLKKDARIYVGPADEPLSAPGSYEFPVPDYAWNFGENWLNPVPYGWHLGVDLDGEQGHPLAAVTDGTVVAVRHFDAAHQEEDYWGNGLALLGDDRRLYIYMHWDSLAAGVSEGSRLGAGDELGRMGRSGFASKPFPTHLHFEIMILRHPEKFRFAFELEPDVLPTPNRVLLPETGGYAVNPYPYLVEWYLNAQSTRTRTTR